MQAIDSAVDRLSTLAGAPVRSTTFPHSHSLAQPDPLKVILLLLVALPLSLLLPKLQAPWVHVYSIAITTLFVGFIQHMPWGLAQLVGMSVATWALCRWGVGLQAKSKGHEGRVNGLRWPWLVMVAAMGQLTIKCVHALGSQSDDAQPNLPLRLANAAHDHRGATTRLCDDSDDSPRSPVA